ncbi:MAG: hypothetical protein NUV65_01385 [Candidatus Roizmanbacteria bacterium]|nr:hypothetical protein [Candidatus Roizmanbacteria bacterium]
MAILSENGQSIMNRRVACQLPFYLAGLAIGGFWKDDTAEAAGLAPVQQADISFPEPNPEAYLYEPYRVFLPGFSGGGRSLTAIRSHLHTEFGNNVFVPSSISTNVSVKAGEVDLTDHSRVLGHTIATGAHNTNIHIVAHSLGSVENALILDALLDDPDWSGKEIKLTFMAGLGFAENGMSGISQTAYRVFEMVNNVTAVEQHMAYPLPEAYYSVNPPEDPEDSEIETIFTDSPEQRFQRRAWFEKQLEIMEPDMKDDILTNLANIDGMIAMAITENNDEELNDALSQREKILKSLIQLFFDEKNISEELHGKYRDLYGETKDNLATTIQYYTAALAFFARTASIVNEGMYTKLRELIEKAEARGVDIKIDFALLERDFIVQESDILMIREGFEEAGISDNLGQFSFLQQYAHASIAYMPDVLGKIF